MTTKLRSVDEVIGRNVKARRGGLDLRQDDLAEWLQALLGTGWSAPMVSRVEDGARSLSVSELLAFAFALGATLDELLDPTVFADPAVRIAAVTKDSWDIYFFQAAARGELRVRVLAVTKSGPRWTTFPTERHPRYPRPY